MCVCGGGGGVRFPPGGAGIQFSFFLQTYIALIWVQKLKKSKSETNDDFVIGFRGTCLVFAPK